MALTAFSLHASLRAHSGRHLGNPLAWLDPPAAGAITPFPRTLIAALLIGLTALSLLYGVLSESFVEGDDITHYLYARYAPAHPRYFLDVWGRPLVTGL